MKDTARGVLVTLAVSLPLFVIAESIDTHSIHPAYYQAIAAATPVFLLPLVLNLRREGAEWPAMETFQAHLPAEIEKQRTSIRETAKAAASLVTEAREQGDAAAAAQGEKLIAKSQKSSDELEALSRRAEGVRLPDRRSFRSIFYGAFIAALASESASLVALGSGNSTYATFLVSTSGLIFLFALLVLIEDANLFTPPKSG